MLKIIEERRLAMFGTLSLEDLRRLEHAFLHDFGEGRFEAFIGEEVENSRVASSDLALIPTMIDGIEVGNLPKVRDTALQVFSLMYPQWSNLQARYAVVYIQAVGVFRQYQDHLESRGQVELTMDGTYTALKEVFEELNFSSFDEVLQDPEPLLQKCAAQGLSSEDLETLRQMLSHAQDLRGLLGGYAWRTRIYHTLAVVAWGWVERHRTLGTSPEWWMLVETQIEESFADRSLFQRLTQHREIGRC